MIKQLFKYYILLLICFVFSCKNENKEVKTDLKSFITKIDTIIDNKAKSDTIFKKEIVDAVEKKETIKKPLKMQKPITKGIENSKKIDSMQNIDLLEDFNSLDNIKNKEQLKVDSILEMQTKNIDSTIYGSDIGMYIPPFYIIDNNLKKFIYGIKSPYTLLYFSDTTEYAYKEPLIDSLTKLWFQDSIYRKSVYTQHISLAIINDHMFSNDSIPGRSISNFKESYNNGGFDLKKVYKLKSYPTYFLLDSTKKIVSINPNINQIKNILN